MILVTGGTGLVGSQLLFDLAKAGHRVRALKRATSSLKIPRLLFSGSENLLQQIEWMDGDVTDLFSLEEALAGVDQLYHCAALVSFHPSDYRQMMKINIEGTANLVNLALAMNIEKFCHVSS